MKRKFLIFLFIVIAIPALLIGVIAFEIWHSNKYKSVLQVVEFGKSESKFILMTDIAGFGDRAWYVYRTRGDDDLTDGMRAAHNRQEALFWNYAEGGDHISDARIEIIDSRYLVFSRGGLFHSLYDLEERRTLINEESPWHMFLKATEKNVGEIDISVEEERRMIHEWKVEALHKPILRIIEQSKTRN